MSIYAFRMPLAPSIKKSHFQFAKTHYAQVPFEGRLWQNAWAKRLERPGEAPAGFRSHVLKQLNLNAIYYYSEAIAATSWMCGMSPRGLSMRSRPGTWEDAPGTNSTSAAGASAVMTEEKKSATHVREAMKRWAYLPCSQLTHHRCEHPFPEPCVCLCVLYLCW